jgi:hypothetical protein
MGHTNSSFPDAIFRVLFLNWWITTPFGLQHIIRKQNVKDRDTASHKKEEIKLVMINVEGVDEVCFLSCLKQHFKQ